MLSFANHESVFVVTFTSKYSISVCQAVSFWPDNFKFADAEQAV